MKYQGTRHQQQPTKTSKQEVGLLLFLYSIVFITGVLPHIIAIIK
jgi:hypothetical protein